MTLGLHDTRRHRRRRRQMAAVKWLLMLGALVTAGFYAYQTGAMLARYEMRDLRAEIDGLTRTIAELQRERDLLAAELEAAQVRERQIEESYRQAMPTGAVRELYELVQQRLAAGVPANRLALVIGAIRSEPNCDGNPDTKRFIVRIPGLDGGIASVSFANGAIRLTAQGEAATTETGAWQAWFDPAKPVTVRFARRGGGVSEASGLLPLHHSVVEGGNDYRFTIAPGDRRGFVTVTGDRCDYP